MNSTEDIIAQLQALLGQPVTSASGSGTASSLDSNSSPGSNSRSAQAHESDPDPDLDLAEITKWRDRIDAIDQLLLRLLNERSTCANSIGHLKSRLKLPIYVPEREKIVLDNVLKGNPGPLNDAAVRHLFERIIDETRSLERQRYQNPEISKPESST